MKEVLDFRLDFGGEEVALNGGDTFGGLGGNQIDAENTAAGFGQVNGDLCWRQNMLYAASTLDILDSSFPEQTPDPRPSCLA